MNIKNIIKNSLFAGALLFGATSQAATIPLPPGVAILEDDNLEYILDAQGNLKETGALEVGDRLRAYVTFQAVVNGQSQVHANLGGALELTGVSEIEIASITGGLITFKPSAAFEAVYGTGAMAALFSDSPADFGTDCHLAGPAQCELEATNGSHWMTTGFADADDFWIATDSLGGGFTSIDLVKALPAVTKVATANFALSILENNTGSQFNEQLSVLSPVFALGGGDDAMTDILGSGDVLGGAGLENGFFARSDFDFQLDRIPEPGSIALFGLGLLAAGSLGRRRKA